VPGMGGSLAVKSPLWAWQWEPLAKGEDIHGDVESHGVDGMKVDELLPYLKQHGGAIRQSILEGTYRPSPVRRVEISKPGGGVRMLGIPTGTGQDDTAGNSPAADANIRRN